MGRLILLAALLAASGAVPAADAGPMEAVRARLDANPEVRADFVQTRRSPDLERPLVARGRMVVWGKAGVIWETTQPARNVVALRTDRTVIVDARGTRTERKAQDDAITARIGRVLRALLHGDAATLEKWFRVTVELDGPRWTITLAPHRGPLASFIETMQVGGADYLETVDIRELGGESTRIQFSNHRPAAPLTEDERSLLALP